MADRGHRNLATKTDRLLVSEMLLVKPPDSVKFLFIYVMVTSDRIDFIVINMNDLYTL